jgi:hypothetical protein
MQDMLDQFPDCIPDDMPVTRMIRDYIAKEGGFAGHTSEHPQAEFNSMLGGAVITRRLDGPTAPALSTWSPPAARADAGRLHRMLMRPAHHLAVRVRRHRLRATARRRVQLARRAPTRPMSGFPKRVEFAKIGV